MLQVSGFQVARNTIQVVNVDMADYPDFCDAYIAYAEFVDGSELNENELEILNENRVLVNELAHNSRF